MKTFGLNPKATAGYPQTQKKVFDELLKGPFSTFFGHVDNPLPQNFIALYRPLSL